MALAYSGERAGKEARLSCPPPPLGTTPASPTVRVCPHVLRQSRCVIKHVPSAQLCEELDERHPSGVRAGGVAFTQFLAPQPPRKALIPAEAGQLRRACRTAPQGQLRRACGGAVRRPAAAESPRLLSCSPAHLQLIAVCNTTPTQSLRDLESRDLECGTCSQVTQSQLLCLEVTWSQRRGS